MQEIVSDLLRKWNLHPYVWNLLIVGASVVLGLLINFILSLVVSRQRNTATKRIFRLSFFRHLVRPLSFFITLLVFNSFLPVMRLNRDLFGRLSHTVEIALIAVFAWLLIKLIRVVQEFVNRRFDIHSKADNLRQRRLLTQLMYVRRVISSIIILLTIGAILLTFETMRRLGTRLLTGVGIGGIIVGFAAQRSLGNLLAGFQIAFTQPIRIDDEVVVEGQFGVVEEITLTYVVVRIWDERRLVLPINYFIEHPFENWTRTTSAMHGSVFIYADYRLPIDWLRAEFLRIVENHPLWDKRTASMVVTDLKETVMEVRALVSGSNSGAVSDLRNFVREQLVKAIAEHHPECLPLTRAVLTNAEKG